jgi:hypothetical protein
LELVQNLVTQGLGIVEDDEGDDAFVDDRRECTLDPGACINPTIQLALGLNILRPCPRRK